jgi:nucleotide-binding universal stress UspA family protein
MIEITRVLCPVDFSEGSRRALRYAAATARWYGAQLTVLHVIPFGPPVDIIPVLALESSQRIWLPDEDRRQLTEGADRFVRDAVGAGLHFDLAVHDAAQVHHEIAAQAEALHADLLVLGSHGRSGAERLFLGSVTEKVLRTVRAPVMIVPAHADAAVPPGDVGFDSILCAVDFSHGSVTALTYAMSFAQEADARLTVVNVIDLHGGPDEDEPDVPLEVAQARAAERAARLARLRALVPDSVRTYCRVETIVEDGKPYVEILRLARQRQSDLVVMGAASHGALGHLLFGSNTHHVVRTAVCPVLAVSGR